jgi:hypothetical protein
MGANGANTNVFSGSVTYPDTFGGGKAVRWSMVTDYESRLLCDEERGGGYRKMSPEEALEGHVGGRDGLQVLLLSNRLPG